MTSPPTSYTTSWDTTHATVARATVEDSTDRPAASNSGRTPPEMAGLWGAVPRRAAA